jgi:hypothetical protein
MPKVKIIFKLPEEAIEFEKCLRGGDLHSILWELTHNVKKSLIKYQDVSEEYENGVNDVYAKIYELLDEYNIILD